MQEKPPTAEAASPYRSSSVSGNSPESVGSDSDASGESSAPISCFTVDTAAAEVGRSASLSWVGPTRALDTVFTTLEQNASFNEGLPLPLAQGAEVKVHLSKADLWAMDLAQDAESPSVRASWDDLTSPAIGLLLAAGYVGASAGVRGQTERQRRSERFGRPQGEWMLFPRKVRQKTEGRAFPKARPSCFTSPFYRSWSLSR